jgi:bacterioferritin-associated ferredoxin
MGCEFECGGCQDRAEDIVEDATANPRSIDKTAA